MCENNLNFVIVIVGPFLNFQLKLHHHPNNGSRYRLTFEAPALSYSAEYFVAGKDKNTFNFSKLPDIVGTGEKYGVQVIDRKKLQIRENIVLTRWSTWPLPLEARQRPAPPL